MFEFRVRVRVGLRVTVRVKIRVKIRVKVRCSNEIHSCLRTFISNTARTATILNRDNTRRQCSKQYSRQCVETDQFWSLLRVNAQAANTR